MPDLRQFALIRGNIHNTLKNNGNQEFALFHGCSAGIGASPFTGVSEVLLVGPIEQIGANGPIVSNSNGLGIGARFYRNVREKAQ